MKEYLVAGLYNFFTSNYQTDRGLLASRSVLLNTFLIIGTISFIILFILNLYFKDDLNLASLDIVAGIIFLATLFDLRINKNEHRTIFVTLFSLTLFMFYFVWINHDKNLGLIWTIFIPILAITLYGHKTGGILSLIYYLFMFSLVIYGLDAWESQNWNLVSLIRYLITSIVLLFVIFVTQYSFVQTQTALNAQTITDPLTQLYNRRKIDDALAHTLKMINRSAKPLSLVILDIDNFKSVNDTYGHLIGDDVLKDVAKILKNTMRDIDTVGRWGGEEFIIILPETPLNEARISMERLRDHMNNHEFPAVGHISCSYGVCTVHSSQHNPQELITCADDALYEAKKTGKDRVCFAELTS